MSKQLWGTGNVYKRGRVWWFYYCARGKTYHKSAKTPKRAEAVKALKNAVGESSNSRVVIAPVAERVTLKQMLDALRDDYVRKGNRSKFVARSHYLLAHIGEDARAVNLTRDADFSTTSLCVARRSSSAPPATKSSSRENAS